VHYKPPQPQEFLSADSLDDSAWFSQLSFFIDPQLPRRLLRCGDNCFGKMYCLRDDVGVDVDELLPGRVLAADRLAELVVEPASRLSTASLRPIASH